MVCRSIALVALKLASTVQRMRTVKSGAAEVALIDLIPGGVRHLARAVLPDKTAEALRETVVQRYYVPSNITREPAGQAFVRRWVKHARPTLYHLDMHITDHCNLNCKGCETYSSLSSPRFASLEVFDRDMTRLAELFESIGQIYLMGGEPLLHPELPAFIRSARKRFPRTKLVLLTNTLLVPRMGDEFFLALRETDCILMCDLYPVGIDIEAVEALCREHGVRLEWTPPVEEFHKVPIDGLGSCDAGRMHLLCKQVANCAIARDGRLYPCQRAAFADIIAERFDMPELNATAADSISLSAVPSGDAAIDFLMQPIPWCAKCDFDAKETYEWARTKRDPSEWLLGHATGDEAASRDARDDGPV